MQYLLVQYWCSRDTLGRGAVECSTYAVGVEEGCSIVWEAALLHQGSCKQCGCSGRYCPEAYTMSVVSSRTIQ